MPPKRMLIMKCSLCPRRCDAIRTETQNIGGFCGQPSAPRLARAVLHFWEEPCISGKNGSGTVFFSGCTLRCVYCQNYEISHGGFGKTVTVERLAEIFRELEDMGAHNINLVSPTQYTHAIKAALDLYRPKIPVVWNSGGYETEETIKSLDEYVDIFLLDFKYLSPDRAAKYSAAPDYPQIAQKALLKAYEMRPECTFEDGIMKRGVIVRHLVLPSATREAIGVFDFVKEHTKNAFFSLMSQYTPCGRAEEIKELSRTVTAREYQKVLDYIIESGFENCFVQERTSSSKEYIPPFDLTGI